MKIILSALSASLLALGCSRTHVDDSSGAIDQTQTGRGTNPPPVITSPTAPNTGSGTQPLPNERPASNNQTAPSGAPTALDQSNEPNDLRITQEIRRSIVIEPGSDEHSLAAKNIQIVTRAGRVTLSGAVRTQAEKNDIEQRARAVKGVTEIDNRLEIVPR